MHAVPFEMYLPLPYELQLEHMLYKVMRFSSILLKIMNSMILTDQNKLLPIYFYNTGVLHYTLCYLQIILYLPLLKILITYVKIVRVYN